MDKPLSKDGVVSMQQRNSDSTYENQHNIKDAFENAVDVAEKEGFGAKVRKFGNKVGGKLQSAAVAFRDKVWTPTKQKVSENSKSIASSLSLGYAAYQTQRLRDKAVIREGKIAKYDSYLAEHTPVSQSGIESVVDSKNVVKEAVASETKAISTTPEVAKKVSQPEIVESSSEGGIIVSEGKSHDSDKSSKESILSEKKASLDAAYKEGMANVISKLRDFLNEFDEKSASIEELDYIGMNVQQAGAYMNNMKQMSQMNQSRELPVVEMEDSTEAEVELGI